MWFMGLKICMGESTIDTTSFVKIREMTLQFLADLMMK